SKAHSIICLYFTTFKEQFFPATSTPSYQAFRFCDRFQTYEFLPPKVKENIRNFQKVFKEHPLELNTQLIADWLRFFEHFVFSKGLPI
ncbi:MAG TPA: hypothetical protein VJ951_02790, partial [Bacteroidales bacterium]|nr:hypothetical protein [Bacteroidales bacterium]